MNIYISVVVWGMYEQYACAVLIEWLVVACSRCKCSVCVSLGAIVSVINGMALHALAKDKDVYCK